MEFLFRDVGAPRILPSVTQFENIPAISRITISSPAVMQPIARLNIRKKYRKQIKPFNFLLTCYISSFGSPIGTNPQRFHLIAPYELDSKKWLDMEWIDQYSGKNYRINTLENYGTRYSARVKTYGDIVCNYEFHPEAKCADFDGKPCDKQTVGLLKRRKISFREIKFIGKESNFLEDVESGLIQSAESIYTEYPNAKRDEWETKIRPALKNIPLSFLIKKSKMSGSALKEIRAGRARPHLNNQQRLAKIAEEPYKKHE